MSLHGDRILLYTYIVKLSWRMVVPQWRHHLKKKYTLCRKSEFFFRQIVAARIHGCHWSSNDLRDIYKFFSPRFMCAIKDQNDTYVQLSGDLILFRLVLTSSQSDHFCRSYRPFCKYIKTRTTRNDCWSAPKTQKLWKIQTSNHYSNFWYAHFPYVYVDMSMLILELSYKECTEKRNVSTPINARLLVMWSCRFFVIANVSTPHPIGIIWD